MYVQINIGRNIGNTPMTITEWITLQKKTVQALYENSFSAPYDDFHKNVEMHGGIGRWYDAQNNTYVNEESLHISYFDPAGYNLDGLRQELRALKIAYGQDAIALITESELI